MRRARFSGADPACYQPRTTYRGTDYLGVASPVAGGALR